MSPDTTDYTLPAEVRAEVEEILEDLPNLRKEAARLNDEFADYMDSIVPKYDQIRTSPTNTVARPTESLAVLHVDQLAKYKRADDTLKAIENGIIRAAWTAKLDGTRGRLRYVLEKNLLDGYSRDNLSVGYNTLTAYRKKAYYFIALELGLYKPDYSDLLYDVDDV